MLYLGDRYGFRTARLHIPCAALEQPLRILHLSDAHLCVGDRAKREFICRATDDDYDLVCFTGDIAEEEEAEALVPGLLSRQPRHGAYAVLGNHDHLRLAIKEEFGEFVGGHARHRGHRTDPLAVQARMQEGGRWRVLLNETERIHLPGDQVLVLAGVDDPFTGYGDLQKTMHHVKQADILLGLVHVPTDLASFSQRGFHLVLSGHTHGGQVRIPGYGAIKTQCDLPREFARGLHYVERTAVHVSQGLGAGRLIRVRLFCPPTAYDITFGGPPR